MPRFDRPRLPDPSTRLPGDFLGIELANDPGRFVVELGADERLVLRDAAESYRPDEVNGVLDARIHPVLAEVSARARRQLALGDGVVLVRGVPVEGWGRDVAAAMFSSIGRAIGRPTAQNLEGELVTDIRDTGADPSDPEVRLYRTRAEQDFHTDGADVIGLLCLHPAASGGLSRLVSSVRVFRRLAERRPDLAPLLFEAWNFHLPGAAARGVAPTFARPIATFDGSKLETFFLAWYLRRADEIPGALGMDRERRELLALYEATANEPDLALDMDFRPGDVQWLRNAFVLHKRTAYVDAPPPTSKRHLLRLWLSAPFLDDATPRFATEEPS